MGCSIIVGKMGSNGPCDSLSKFAFDGSWGYTPFISKLSPAFEKLIWNEGLSNLSDCIQIINEMRIEFNKLEKEKISDFEPISADRENKWGKRWRKKSRYQFLSMGLRDPNSSSRTDFTLSEIKTIIKAIIDSVDWAISRFGENNVFIEIE